MAFFPPFCISLYKTVLLQDEEEISTSPGVSEFVSDAFDACNLNQEDLRKEMEQLVLDKKKEETSVVEGTAIITFCILNTQILRQVDVINNLIQFRKVDYFFFLLPCFKVSEMTCSILQKLMLILTIVKLCLIQNASCEEFISKEPS